MKRKTEDIYVFIAKGDVNAVVNTCRSVNNEQLNDILLEIVYYGTTEMLDLISDAGIRCNAIYKNYTLLEYAVVCNRPDMVKWCLKHPDFTLVNRYECSYAAKYGYIDILKLLLDAGIDASGVDETGSNGLHWAAQENRQEICDILLNHRCCVNQLDCHGDTPLYTAASWGNKQIAEALLKHNAHVDLCGIWFGTTPFMISCAEDFFEICNMLLEFGADINATDSDGMTAAHRAAIKNDEKLLEYLRHHDADFSIKDAKDVSATDILQDDELRKSLYYEYFEAD